jgi:pimeloyl-ACP methyl ester carboxylesterase
VLLHGWPASSVLDRKVIDGLVRRGLRGVAFDLPGLGLADRPEDFDYSIRGLARFAAGAVDELGLEQFHLVVHDAGGPVGFELMQSTRDRILSVTILNTVVVGAPRFPFPGELLARVRTTVPSLAQSPKLWRRMMFGVGILDRTAVSLAEVDAYRKLAIGPDAGAAYLRIMRALRDPDAGPRDYSGVVDTTRNPYPVQIIWGARDPALTLRRFGLPALAATRLRCVHAVPARHFLQEDQSAAIADLVADLAARQRS